MPRWILFLLLPLAACAGGPEPQSAPPPRVMPEAQAAPAPPPRAEAHAGLLGATPEALRARLGEPLLRRSEGPAQIWLYAAGGCQLDILLYAGEAGLRVAHLQARAGGIPQRSAAACLRDLSAQATRPPPEPPPPDAPGGFDV